jgi:hypothetical protein
MTNSTMVHCSPQLCFEAAILAGALSHDPDSANFVGDYMYMFSDHTRHAFKHKMTRAYLYVPRRAITISREAAAHLAASAMDAMTKTMED